MSTRPSRTAVAICAGGTSESLTVTLTLPSVALATRSGTEAVRME
ncbi:Uncharacterised protein [Bordetella pertussis]|nr:Uncharacterised protein [Bordetella pertussis]